MAVNSLGIWSKHSASQRVPPNFEIQPGFEDRGGMEPPRHVK
jgi:hypothetical protein